MVFVWKEIFLSHLFIIGCLRTIIEFIINPSFLISLESQVAAPVISKAYTEGGASQGTEEGDGEGPSVEEGEDED